MSHNLNDRYEHYADEFDPLKQDRRARKKRKKSANHQPKVTDEEILEQIADLSGTESLEFETTYTPSLYERDWLYSSLRTFYDRALITDVLSLVKGGKEASVYRCRAHESTGKTYLAAKVYRPRQFRSLSNDTIYREGRELIGSDGKKIRKTDRRAIRAVEKKSSYGSLLAHTSWLMHEFTTMHRLRESGVTVPEPVASGENAILMTYYGDGNLPAPTLIEVKLEHDEAQHLYHHIMDDIEQMLRQGVVHGDLSAYNILYWDQQPIIIDLPQVVDPESNSNAYAIFKRDVTRICDYFQKAGIDTDPATLAETLWSRYYSVDPQDRAADESRLMVDDD